MRKVALYTTLATGFLVAHSAAHADISIGVVGPMSGSFAVFGEQMSAGAEQAIADINATGGVLGEKLSLEVADDRCDRKRGEPIANQMVGRGVAMVVGHLCSGASTIASATYHDADIIQISPGARASQYTDERPGPGIFRLSGRNDAQGRVVGEFLATRFDESRVAIVRDNSPYGIDLADAALRAMNEAGKREVFFEAFPANNRDFGPLFARLDADTIDVLFFAGYHTEAALIARRMRDDNIDTILISGDALMTEEFIEIAGEAGNGALMTYPPDPLRFTAASDVIERLAEKGISADGYVLNAYAAVQAWASAVATAGSLDYAAVAQTLNTGTFDTVLGSVEFDEKGDVNLPAYVVYEWRDGAYDYAPM